MQVAWDTAKLGIDPNYAQQRYGPHNGSANNEQSQDGHGNPPPPPASLPPVITGATFNFENTAAAAAQDPNDLLAPGGFGAENFIGSGQALPYRIDFENESAATAPAQAVTITDQLAPTIDWTTFHLAEVGFGDTTLTIPGNAQHYQATVPMTYNGKTFDVLVDAGIHSDTGQVYATFQSIDPNTQLPPDVLTGFLPPEDGTGRGMGHISYTVQAKTDVTTGTEIRTVALITFDQNKVIATDQVDENDASKGHDPSKQALVTIDADLPTSSITTASVTQAKSDIHLTLQGQDIGSGLGGFDVMMSDNGGAYVPLFTNLTGRSVDYQGQQGHTYRFYSIAHDQAGNIETAPNSPDTTIILVPTQQNILSKQHPKLSFIDADGTTVTATWTGTGTATLDVWNDPVTHHGDIRDITIAGSDAHSSLTIKPTKGRTTLETLDATGALGALNLASVNILDHVNLDAAVSAVTLGNLVGGADLALSAVLLPAGAHR